MRALPASAATTWSQWMDRNTESFTQMGGEGANWIGEAPFSNGRMCSQNLGDGTYDHSGYLALRAAVAAGVNITYKILFNDAVAMTGGQPLEGGAHACRHDRASSRRRKRQAHRRRHRRAGQISGRHATGRGADRQGPRELDAVQRELRAIPGVTVLIYDQTCAAEKRRRRKKGEMPDPDRRVIINELVCEGCGDCGVKSNCVSVQPLETEFGRKRVIDQSSCNKDFSCLEGFCPAWLRCMAPAQGRPRSNNSRISRPAAAACPRIGASPTGFS